MKKYRFSGITASLAVAFTFAVAAAPVRCEPTKQLNGGIVFDDMLPPAPTNLSVGDAFNERTKVSLPESTKRTVSWNKIPAWLAGLWRQESTTLVLHEVLQKDMRTGQLQFKKVQCKLSKPTIFQLGYFRDKRGDIWQPDVSELWGRSEYKGDEFVKYDHDLTSEICESDENHVVFKTTSLNVSVDKKTKKITEVWQDQTLTTLRKVSDTRLNEHKVARIFGPDGHLIVESVITDAVAFKKAPFIKQAKPAFREFLRTHGLSDLEPPMTKGEQKKTRSCEP